MENFTPVSAIVGGLCIGLSATLLMWFNGRIAGISGIFHGAFDGAKNDTAWRWWFVGGLLLGAGVYLWLVPLAFTVRTDYPAGVVALAGLLVGFGTRMGSGCTSGHGVCGIARFSLRSIIATLVFVCVGIVTTYIVRHLLGIGL
ncbi:MAG: YeeE/YedE family protein [Gammaproteobacteria bacterium]|nr:YeeE/YedE family protein [Gammaproteobacteria bacterium]